MDKKFLEISQIKDRSKLEIRKVDFAGDNLIAVKNQETGKIYTGISFVCKGIGFSKDQKDRQVKNVQSDEVLNTGCVKFDAGVIDRNNEVLAIELDYLPLWLAKISITPKMKNEQPEVAKKLINYQLKAKDVLADAFIKKESVQTVDTSELSPELQMFKQIFDTVAKNELEQKQMKQDIAETKEKVKGIRDIVALNSVDWRADSKALIVSIANKLGGNQFIQDIYKEAYTLLEKRAACQLKIRKTNKQKKMALEGVCKSKINAVSNLDIIGEDKRLLECFLAIVKELAIKYGVNREAESKKQIE